MRDDRGKQGGQGEGKMWILGKGVKWRNLGYQLAKT